MDLVNKEVKHGAFGKGNVINYDDTYININFESGEKRFIFPDVFKRYITFTDEKANELVNKKIEKKEERLEKEEAIRIEKERERVLLLEEQKALEEERLNRLKQKKRIKNSDTHSKVQSVFWVDPGEEEEIFRDWQVFTGEIKSGKNKGKPRQFARMSPNSACLITKRKEDVKEEDRKILGMFLANESFDGRECEDGYITAHPDYRIELTQEESNKMLFWNYYLDENDPTNTVWNSGRQRYFDNTWMAQILRDIVSLREDPEEKKEAKDFFDHFCQLNFINQDELPDPKGALVRE